MADVERIVAQEEQSRDRKRGKVIAILALQPCRRTLVAGVVLHVADNGVLTGNVPVPLLERRVNGLLPGVLEQTH